MYLTKRLNNFDTLKTQKRHLLGYHQKYCNLSCNCLVYFFYLITNQIKMNVTLAKTLIIAVGVVYILTQLYILVSLSALGWVPKLRWTTDQKKQFISRYQILQGTVWTVDYHFGLFEYLKTSTIQHQQCSPGDFQKRVRYDVMYNMQSVSLGQCNIYRPC